VAARSDVRCHVAADSGYSRSFAIYIDDESSKPWVSEPFAVLEDLNGSIQFHHGPIMPERHGRAATSSRRTGRPWDVTDGQYLGLTGASANVPGVL
jgi:hypothetical protein